MLNNWSKTVIYRWGLFFVPVGLILIIGLIALYQSCEWCFIHFVFVIRWLFMERPVEFLIFLRVLVWYVMPTSTLLTLYVSLYTKNIVLILSMQTARRMEYSETDWFYLVTNHHAVDSQSLPSNGDDCTQVTNHSHEFRYHFQKAVLYSDPTSYFLNKVLYILFNKLGFINWINTDLVWQRAGTWNIIFPSPLRWPKPNFYISPTPPPTHRGNTTVSFGN